MKKVLRRLCQIVLILVVVVVVVLAAVLIFLGPAVKRGVERIGPKLLGVPVTVEKVSINVWSGRVGLKSLRIGNPDSFSSDPALALDELHICVRMGSLLGHGAIEVLEIVIDHPRIAYEVVKGEVNLTALQRQMETRAGSKGAKNLDATDDSKSDRLYIIDRFECRNGAVLCRADLTMGEPVVVSLPLIAATGIGRKSGGATLAEVSERILLEILNGVGTVATRFFTNYVPGRELLGKGAEGAGNAVKGAVKSIHLPF